MTLGPSSRIVIAGAGSIGCYLGGHLALAGRNVTLLLREPLAEAIAGYGLRVSDLDHGEETVPTDALALSSDPAEALAEADIVLVTVKCGGTEPIAELIARHAPETAMVVSLQNGVGNVSALRERLGPARRVIAGMVPFNVVQTRKPGEAPRFHRASSGRILIGQGVEGLLGLLDVPGLAVAEHEDMEPVLWGKLLINLNNALVALSDLPLPRQLADRHWRLLLSGQMREGLAVLKAAKIRAAPIEGIPPRLIALVLRLPDALFRLAARRMLAVHPEARSSMWEDLQARRKTEIDYLQGEIVRLAARHGLLAPLNQRVMELIKGAEEAGQGSPGLGPAAVEAPHVG